MKELKTVVGLGASTIYRLMQEGRFPKQMNVIGPKSSAWLASEVEAWMQERIAARDRKNGKAA